MNFEETPFSPEHVGGLGILSFPFLLAKTVGTEGSSLSFILLYSTSDFECLPAVRKQGENWDTEQGLKSSLLELKQPRDWARENLHFQGQG